MPYLEKKTMETMRYCNIIFTIPRTTNVDVVVDGYVIPKGKELFVIH